MLHSPTAHFVRHYLEMVVAMLLGMAVFGIPAGALLEAPELELLGMATAMTVPMVAWMRHRGHGWIAASEMSASMYLPTAAAIALGWAGVLDDVHAQMMVQHVAMFPAMLVAMLLRRDEYTRHAHEPALAGS